MPPNICVVRENYAVWGCGCRAVIETSMDVTVPETSDGMLTGHHRREQGAVLLRYRIEPGVVFAVSDAAPAQVVQLLDGLAF